ncbi:MAG: hypothetical protein FJ122_04455 [Deltaproteobacteria bacterium]|nr:hypothetical protein [Deltaproteobacteria bacterium]
MPIRQTITATNTTGNDMNIGRSIILIAHNLEIPAQTGHRFRFKPATDSDSNRPPIPIQIGRAFRSKSAGHSGANRPPFRRAK